MSKTRELSGIKVQAERAVLAAVRLPDSNYDVLNPLGELAALAQQAGAVVVGEIEQRLQKPVAGTYMGTGKLEELRGLCEATDASVVIFDHELSPKQISKIEEAVERKVLDRSELILDIFASRATTHEAKLQVELAQLQYTYPRLRAMWSHLERIVGTGGIGGVGTRGPGEQQLEIDRRIVQRKKVMLQRELEQIHARKRRMVQKRNAEHFTVGLVGYTNAGKSTLFNTLTTGGAYADDRLFATLMTRTREWKIGKGDQAGGGVVMLSDTVGFVRDLPHHLVASFRATLEEATHADMLFIVLDVSDESAQMHYQTVMGTLDEIEEDVRKREAKLAKAGSGEVDVQAWRSPRRVVLLNKVDKLGDNRELLVWERRLSDAGLAHVAICAREPDGRGHSELRQVVSEAMEGAQVLVEVTVPMRDGKTVGWVEQMGRVEDRRYENGTVVLRVWLGEGLVGRLAGMAGVAVRRECGLGVREEDRSGQADDGW